MDAVIKTGCKQYKVAAGEKIKVEQIAADVGQEIVIDQVLAVGDGAALTVGTPLVSGASVASAPATLASHICASWMMKSLRRHGNAVSLRMRVR